MELCISCKRKIINTAAVKFSCPKCGKYEIVRCKHCREMAANYKCPSCGFEGPN